MLFKQDLFNKLNRVSERRIQTQRSGEMLQDAAVGQAAGKVTASLGRFWSYQSARRDRFEASQFTAATGILSKDFDYTLRKELSKFYRSDGTVSFPSENYSSEIVPGFNLTREDFVKKGKRLSYTDIYQGAFEKFRIHRLAGAPNTLANQSASPVLDRVALQGRIHAHKWEGIWSMASIANAGNSVIRAFKDRLSKTQGFSESDFQYFVTGLGDVYSSGSEYVDQGRLSASYRVALGDLLKAGVTEAGTMQDNEMALRVLANTPQYSTGRTRKATAGLQPKDLAYLEARKKGFSNVLKYSQGERPPTQADRLLPWAISQMSEVQREDLTDRALKAFEAQTKIARSILTGRVQGLQSGLNSSAVKDKGFREEFRQSVIKGLQDTDKLYPQDLFPMENLNRKASLFAAGEALDFRDFMSNVPMYAWENQIPQTMEAARQKLEANLGEQNKAMVFAILPQLEKNIRNMATTEVKLRQAAPFEAVLRARKDVNSLNSKLTLGDYKTAAHKGADQKALQTLVRQQSLRMGMPPSFLSVADRAALESMGRLGDSHAIFAHMQVLNDRYGWDTFYDHIVPEVSAMKGIPDDGKFAYFLREPNIAQLFISANKGVGENLKLLDSDVKKKVATGLGDSIGEHRFWVSVFGGDYNRWNVIDDYITQRVGNNATSRGITTAMRSSVQNMAISRMVQGTSSDVTEAIDSSIETLLRGLAGSAHNVGGIEWEGKKILPPPQYNLSEDMTERLQGALRNRQFIEQRIVPQVLVNQKYQVAANAMGIPVSELLVQTFQDPEISPWLFMEEGIVLGQQYPDLNITGPVVDRTTGVGVTIAYNDLPSVAVWY